MPKCSIIQNVECARNAELRQSSSQWSEEYSSAKCFIDFVVLLFTVRFAFSSLIVVQVVSFSVTLEYDF